MIAYSTSDSLNEPEVVELYESVGWSSAKKPRELLQGLRASHRLATARTEGRLVGLANALSDGHLVVYYPHLLVHADFQGRGVGRSLMAAVMEPYHHLHQQMLTADAGACAFYERCGFVRAGSTVPLWIYAGDDHSAADATESGRMRSAQRF
jgi:GNAT superfamily N-acetyltransferase